MAVPEILRTEEQRLEFIQIPPNISEWKIAKHYSFTENDPETISLHRKDYNKLGFAIQLCCLRNPGWSFGSINETFDADINVQMTIVKGELFIKGSV